MKKNLVVIALLLVFAVSATSAHAGPAKRRMHRQHERIAEGVKSGELTHKEASELREDQRGIREERRDFKANDGKIDAGEHAKLAHDQNVESRKIHRLKHNGRRRN